MQQPIIPHEKGSDTLTPIDIAERPTPWHKNEDFVAQVLAQAGVQAEEFRSANSSVPFAPKAGSVYFGHEIKVREVAAKIYSHDFHRT